MGLKELFPPAAFVLALGIAACIWRVVFLLRGWRPAGAIVYSHDFDEASQSWNPLVNSDGNVRINETVRFRDEDGAYHEVALRRTVSRFFGPDAAHKVWYDPADPDRVTDLGPGHWSLVAMGLGCALASLADAVFRLPS